MAASKIRLAILDDYQGIAASKFSQLSGKIDVTSFPETLNVLIPEQKAALISRLQPFTIVSTMRERTALPADVINSLPNLKLLLTTGMKNAAIDMAACTQRGIVVAGAKGIGYAGLAKPPTSLDSTLQHTWALILGIARNIARDDAGVKNGGWQNSLATGLSGKTLGLLGFGKLGADTARVGVLAFGMKVLAWSTSLTQAAADEKAKAFGLPEGTFKAASSKEELLQNADVLSIHYVLSERSRDILGAKELALLKSTAILINTSRGPLVNEQAFLSVLKQGKIQGAAIDVYNAEPLPLDSEWRTTKWGQDGRSEVLLSPHMGYAEEGAMNRWYEDTVENVKTWLDGKAIATKLNN
jgi:lactate dehydrogenase-like 2-hydroxyacid dehydrogenase